MSLVGNLEDLGLGDILQIVSLSRKSGILSLAWGEVKGRIFFRDGQVVAATSTQGKRSIGRILSEHLEEFPDLLPQLAHPGTPLETKRELIDKAVNALPSAAHAREVLVKDMGFPAAGVEGAIREQIESTVFHFFSWPEGTFSFELQEIEKELAVLPPPDHVFVLEPGLSPQFLAMEGTRLQDERKRTAEEAVGPPLRPGIPAGKERPLAAGAECEPGESNKAASAVEVERSPSVPAAEEDFSSISEALAYYERQEKAKQGEAMKETGVPPAPPVAPRPLPEPEFRQAAEAEGDSLSSEAGGFGEARHKAAAGKEVPPGPVIVPAGPGGHLPASDLVIVDDDPFVLESLVHHLAAKGHKIRTFTEVSTALLHLQESVDMGVRPTVVLTDLLMPDSSQRSTLGGLEVLEKTRRIHPAVSVYLMTDYENLPAQARALELGARFFFTKPKSSQLEEDYSSPELVNFVQVVENALQSEPRPEAGAPVPPGGEKLVNLGEELRKEFGDEEISVPGEGMAVVPSRGLHMLKAMINELNDPASNGQITLLILRFAAELMNRAVIFVVAKNQLAGLGQFGINIDGADAVRHVRQIRIPLSEPSIFREAVQKRMPIKKPLKPTKWNDYLVKTLGGILPREVFVSPIIAGGKIAAILYGDNVPEDKEIGDTESLEIFLAQAGLAMEKALLERRLREMGRSAESGGG